MKKSLSTLLLTLLMALGASAQITSYPVIQDFENGMDGWTTFSNDSNSLTDWSIVDCGYNYDDGTYYHCLQSQAYYFDTLGVVHYCNPDEILVSPAMNINLDNMVLEFTASGPGTIEVYVVTSAESIEDILSVTPDTTIINISYNSSQYRVPLTGYDNLNVHIAIRYFVQVGINITSLTLDDIVVRTLDVPVIELPNIALLETDSNIAITAIPVEGNTPDLSYVWTSTMVSSGHATMTFNDSVMTINYGATGFDTVSVTASNFLGTSTATRVFRIITLMPDATTPFHEDFEDSPETGDYQEPWAMVDGNDNRWVIDTAISNGSSHSLYIIEDNNSATGQSTCYAIRSINIDAAGEYLYQYDLIKKGVGTNLELWLADDYHNINNPSITGISIWGVYSPVNDWETVQGTINVDTPGRYYIVFKMKRMYYTENSYDTVAIDNFHIVHNTCPPPTNIVIDSIGNDFVTLHWTPGGDETTWEISINGGSPITAYTNPFTILDLEPNSHYTLSIRSLCDDDNLGLVSEVTFDMPCLPISELPYRQTFENYDPNPNQTDSIYIACWTRGANSYYAQRPRLCKQNGNNCLEIVANGTNYSYTILPEMDFSSFDLQLSFDMTLHYYNYPSSTLIVGLVDSPTYVASVQIDTLAEVTATTTSWEEKVIDLSTETLTGRRIIIITKQTPGLLNGALLDNITIEHIPSCIKPNNLELTNVNSTMLTVAWNAGDSNSASYDVAFRQNGIGDAWQHYTTNSTSYVIDGLSHYTDYDIAVRAICENGDTSQSVSATFRTACEGISSFPYLESFEGDISCWRTESPTSYAFDDWAVDVDYGIPHSGTKCLTSYSNQYSSTDATLITPIISIPDDAPSHIAFVWHIYHSLEMSSHVYVTVNHSDNLHNLDNFTDTLAIINETNGYRKYCAFLDQYYGEDIRIAFHHVGDSGISFNKFLLDDVEIREAAAPLVEIEGGDLIDAHFANPFRARLTEGVASTMTWSSKRAAAGDAILMASGNDMTIEYGNIGTDTITLIATNGYGADTVSKVVNIRYINHVETLPYITGFEDPTDNGKWMLIGEENEWVIHDVVNNGGTNSLYISSDNGDHNEYTTPTDYSKAFSYALRGIALDSGDYIINYDWHCNGAEFNALMRVALLPPGTSIITNETIINFTSPSISDDYISLDHNQRLFGHPEWQSEEIICHVPKTGVYQLAFLWYSYTNTYNFPAAAVDNISVQRITCHKPSDVTFDDIQSSSVSLHWTPGDDETHWILTLGDSLHYLVDSVPSATITDLEPGTLYNMTLRSICSVGDTSFEVNAPFSTPCSAITTLPWKESFEDYGPSSYETPIPCWNHIGGGVTNIDSTATAYGNAVKITAYNNETENVMVLPLFSTQTFDLHMSFFVAPNDQYTDTLEVGYVTDESDYTTFVPLRSFAATSSEFSTPSASIPFVGKHVYFVESPTDTRMAIRVRNNDFIDPSIWYIDSVTIDLIDEVNPFECYAPSGVYNPNVTTTVAVIDWVPMGHETQWQMQFSAEPSPRIVSTHPYVVANLTPATEYSVCVRAVCEDGDVSDWSDTLFFTTESDGQTSIATQNDTPFSIQPNPASGSATITLGDHTNAIVSILDMNGRKIEECDTKDVKLTVDLRHYAKGAYFVRVTSERGTTVRKLVVQ